MVVSDEIVNYLELMAGILLIFLLLLFVYISYLYFKIYKTLKDEYLDIWLQLDKPTLFIGNSIRNSILVSRFIKSKAYLELNNIRLNKIITSLKTVNNIYILLVILLFSLVSILIIVSNSK